MLRLAPKLLGLGLIFSLAACGGDTCESVQEEIAEIGREISQSAENPWDRAEELDELRQKLEDMGCLGNV